MLHNNIGCIFCSEFVHFGEIIIESECMSIKRQKREDTLRIRAKRKKKGKPGSGSSVKRPNALLYCFAYALGYPLLKLLFRLDDGRKDFVRPKGPFLVIANHSTMLDFLFVMLPFYPRRINAVTTSRYFFSRPLNKILPMMGCIPKDQFEPDFMSIKHVKSVLKRGGSILLFPEGRCSTDGAFSGIHNATGKLVKNLGVPVISCYIDGAYTCLPHWRKGIRLGRVRVSMSELFSIEDTQELSVDEINNAICARLSGEDEPRSGKPIRTLHARRLAEGLEHILYWCPKCGMESTMVSKGNEFRCTACGNCAVVAKTGKLVPKNDSIIPDTVSDWYVEQARHLSQELSEDMEPIIGTVNIQVTPSGKSGGAMQTGRGELVISPKGWAFEGLLNGEPAELFFPVETVPAVPFEYDGDFMIYAHGNIYRFMPEYPRLGLRYSLLGELAHRKFSTRSVITHGHVKT